MITISCIIAIIIILDRLSKSFALHHLPVGQDVGFLDPVFHFHYHENRGAAWGILQDHPWVFMILSSVAIIAILVFLFINRKKKLHPVLRYGLTVIAAGGIGNMIDRIANGYVIDFIEFGFVDFPIFNVADSFVTVGSFAIIIYLLIDIARDTKKKEEKSTSIVQPEDKAQDHE